MERFRFTVSLFLFLLNAFGTIIFIVLYSKGEEVLLLGQVQGWMIIACAICAIIQIPKIYKYVTY